MTLTIAMTERGEEILKLLKEIQQYRDCCAKEGFPVPRITDHTAEQWRELLGRGV